MNETGPRRPVSLTVSESLLFLADCSLSGGKSCDRNAERRTTHIIDTNLVEEMHGIGISSMLSTYTAHKFGPAAASSLIP